MFYTVWNGFEETMFKWFLTIATAKPMTVMMPKGTSNIPMPELSITTSGNAVAFKLVSFVVIVTVINILEVILSLLPGLVERKGIVEVVGVVAVVEKKLVVVLVPFAAMFECSCSNWSVDLHYLCRCCYTAQLLVCVMISKSVFVLVRRLLRHRRCIGHKICKIKPNTRRRSW